MVAQALRLPGMAVSMGLLKFRLNLLAILVLLEYSHDSRLSSKSRTYQTTIMVGECRAHFHGTLAVVQTAAISTIETKGFWPSLQTELVALKLGGLSIVKVHRRQISQCTGLPALHPLPTPLTAQHASPHSCSSHHHALNIPQPRGLLFS